MAPLRSPPRGARARGRRGAALRAERRCFAASEALLCGRCALPCCLLAARRAATHARGLMAVDALAAELAAALRDAAHPAHVKRAEAALDALARRQGITYKKCWVGGARIRRFARRPRFAASRRDSQPHWRPGWRR